MPLGRAVGVAADGRRVPVAFRVIRERTVVKTGATSTETAYGITSVDAGRAGPDRLLAWNRGHWQVENGNHHRRDATLGEDASRIRARHAPRQRHSQQHRARRRPAQLRAGPVNRAPHFPEPLPGVPDVDYANGVREQLRGGVPDPLRAVGDHPCRFAAANPNRSAARQSRRANADGSASTSLDAALSIPAVRRAEPASRSGRPVFGFRRSAVWNTATFPSRVFDGRPSSAVPASRRTTGTPVPSGLQYIVSAGASRSVGAVPRRDLPPTCFAARSARFAVATTPASRPRRAAAFSKLASDASSASAHSTVGVPRTPSRPAGPARTPGTRAETFRRRTTSGRSR